MAAKVYVVRGIVFEDERQLDMLDGEAARRRTSRSAVVRLAVRKLLGEPAGEDEARATA